MKVKRITYCRTTIEEASVVASMEEEVYIKDAGTKIE